MYAESESVAAEAARNAFAIISEVESTLSDYRPSSESMRAASSPPNQWISISPLFSQVLEISEELYILSDGAFDPTVGAYTHLWRAAKKEHTIPSMQQLEAARFAVGFSNIELDEKQNQIRFAKPNMILDFGAIGKGYAADRALQTLRTHGIHSALIDVGGDLTLGDPPPDKPEGWLVSIQSGVNEAWSTRLHSTSIATSGDLERHYVHDGIRYSHIIDPFTGLGITNQSSVTVIADNGATADAAASIVSVLGMSGVRLLETHYPGIRIYLKGSEAVTNESQ